MYAKAECTADRIERVVNKREEGLRETILLPTGASERLKECGVLQYSRLAALRETSRGERTGRNGREAKESWANFFFTSFIKRSRN